MKDLVEALIVLESIVFSLLVVYATDVYDS